MTTRSAAPAPSAPPPSAAASASATQATQAGQAASTAQAAPAASPAPTPTARASGGRLAAALRRTWRIPWSLLLLFGGLFAVIALFPLMRPARRDATVAAWSAMLLRACGLRTNIHYEPGTLPLAARTGGRMVVANHVSWLDIFLIDAVAPSCFIAKADIARWPLIGTLVGRVGTIFLERGKRHAVHDALVHVAGQLEAGRRIAIFPEGTTGSGENLMPFHANLIQSAVRAGVPVDPVGLRYTGLAGECVSGDGGTMDFVGEITFVGSWWRIIGAPGVIAHLHVLPEIPPAVPEDNKARHRVAGEARDAIAVSLGLPLEDNLPETVRALRGGRL